MGDLDSTKLTEPSFNIMATSDLALKERFLAIYSGVDLQLMDENNDLLDDDKAQQQQILGEVIDGGADRWADLKTDQLSEDDNSVRNNRRLSSSSLETSSYNSISLLDEVLGYIDFAMMRVRKFDKLTNTAETPPSNNETEQMPSVVIKGSGRKVSYKEPCTKPALAPATPKRKMVPPLPFQEIRRELDIIDMRQEVLEDRANVLRKMVRDRCEGTHRPYTINSQMNNAQVVDQMILVLFDLVNEKNKLFRRQCKLMRLRRQHRLELEYADVEYEIRVLMSQSDRSKSESDKLLEETLIARLLEVVELRNEIVDCMEMDRLRALEEDLSIKQHYELHQLKTGYKRHSQNLKEVKERDKNTNAERKNNENTVLNAVRLRVRNRKMKFLSYLCGRTEQPQ